MSTEYAHLGATGKQKVSCFLLCRKDFNLYTVCPRVSDVVFTRLSSRIIDIDM